MYGGMETAMTNREIPHQVRNDKTEQQCIIYNVGKKCKTIFDKI